MIRGAPSRRGVCPEAERERDGQVEHQNRQRHYGGPTLANDDRFGISVTALGDGDGDGVGTWPSVPLATIRVGRSRSGVRAGLNADGDGQVEYQAASGINGGPTLADFGQFGTSVTALGDFDGTAWGDMAVGAERDDTGGSWRGAV